MTYPVNWLSFLYLKRNNVDDSKKDLTTPICPSLEKEFSSTAGSGQADTPIPNVVSSSQGSGSGADQAASASVANKASFAQDAAPESIFYNIATSTLGTGYAFGQVVLQTIGATVCFKEISGWVVTSKAMGGLIPFLPVAVTSVTNLAFGVLMTNPTLALASTIGATLFLFPEPSKELAINASTLTYNFGKIAYGGGKYSAEKVFEGGKYAVDKVSKGIESTRVAANKCIQEVTQKATDAYDYFSGSSSYVDLEDPCGYDGSTNLYPQVKFVGEPSS